MILLDGLDKQQSEQQAPKLASEASSSYVVARPTTPTPSLPDYEASQAQLRPTLQPLPELQQDELRPTTQSYSEIQHKRSRRRRCRKCTMYALGAYFVLSVVIIIPVLVVKLRKTAFVKANPYQPWEDNVPIHPKSVTLGGAPLRISAAKACNSWDVTDRPDGSMFVSELQYNVPVNGPVFLDTNITYSSNTSYLNQFAGTLFVAVNDDVSDSEAVVHVTMHHSTPELRNSTNICTMQTGGAGGGGVYIFAPKNLSITDALVFNITLLLPRNNTSPRNIPSLLCHLPHFQHTYDQLDPLVTFDSVVFGGAMSGVYVESLQAGSAVVKASSAEVRGKFKVSQQLSLETVSAPINVDAHLYYERTRGPTFLHLATGNSMLNANVTLYVPPTVYSDSDSDDEDEQYFPGPQFLAFAETFNAPLNLDIEHDSESSPAHINVRTVNNIGTTRVALDSRYEGTFDVSTMFAQADVLTWDGTNFDDHYDNDGDGEDDGDENKSVTSNSSGSGSRTITASALFTSASASVSLATDDVIEKGKVRMILPSFAKTDSASSEASSTGTKVERCLEYDLISSSQIKGWVGTPPRPSLAHYRKYSNMSHVEVISSLNSAQLILRP